MMVAGGVENEDSTFPPVATGTDDWPSCRLSVPGRRPDDFYREPEIICVLYITENYA